MYFYYSNCKNTTFFLNRFFFCLFYVFLEFNKCVGSVLGSYSLCSFCCIVLSWSKARSGCGTEGVVSF